MAHRSLPSFPFSSRFAAILMLVLTIPWLLAIIALFSMPIATPWGPILYGVVMCAVVAGLSIAVLRESARAADGLALVLGVAIAFECLFMPVEGSALKTLVGQWPSLIAIVCLLIGRTDAWAVANARSGRTRRTPRARRARRAEVAS